MDPTKQIKNSLISRIKETEDLNFLKALQTILDTSEKGLYQLTQEQQDAIEEGREDIKRGDIYDNKEVITSMREWLKKK